MLGVAAAVVPLLAGVLLPGLAAEGYGHDFTVGMVVLGVSMLVVFPTWAYAAALQSVQRYDLYSVGGVVSSVGFTAGAVLAVETGAGVIGVAIAYGGSLVLGGLVMGWLLRRAQRVVLLPPRGSVEAAKGMWRFGTLVLLADSMTFVGQRMDTVVIAAVRGAVQAAPYAAAVRLQSGLQSFTLPLSTCCCRWWPTCGPAASTTRCAGGSASPPAWRCRSRCRLPSGSRSSRTTPSMRGWEAARPR